MLNVFTLTNGRLFQEEIESLHGLADVRPVWVDLESPTSEEKDWVRERFGVTIPSDAVDDDLEESARFYEEDNGELHIRSDFLIDAGDGPVYVAHGDSIDVPADIADQLCAQVGQWVKEPVKKSTKKPSTPTTED